jgi:hypothetical protein
MIHDGQTLRERSLPSISHDDLVRRAGRWLKSQGCKCVLLEPGYGYPSEVPDAIGWTPRARSIVVECKTSRTDFFNDQNKTSRRQEQMGEDGSLGDERWYLVPWGLVDASEMPEGWGLLSLRKDRAYKTKRPTARSANTERQAKEMRLLLGVIFAMRDGGSLYTETKFGKHNLGLG